MFSITAIEYQYFCFSFIELTRLCMDCGSIWGSKFIAFVIASTISLGLGSARTTISPGRTYYTRATSQKREIKYILEIYIISTRYQHDVIKFANKNKNSDDHASGTPPTRVLTVSNPQLAASNMAIQNASVKELSK